MRYKASKRVRVMSGLMWFMVGVAATIVIMCIAVTYQVNNNIESLGL